MAVHFDDYFACLHCDWLVEYCEAALGGAIGDQLDIPVLALAVGATGAATHRITCVEEVVESLDGVAVVQTGGGERVVCQRKEMMQIRRAVEK